MPWVPFAAAVLTPGLVYGAFWILRGTGLRRLRRAAAEGELHWTERARLGWGARVGSTTTMLVLLVAAVLGFGWLSTGPLSATPAWLNAVVAGSSTVVVSVFALRRLGKELGLRPTRVADDVRGSLFLLRRVLAAGLWVIGWSLLGGAVFEGKGLESYGLALFVLAAPFVVLPTLFRWLRLAVPDEELARRLQPLFERAGVTPRRVERLELSTANAFAFPLGQRVAVTRGLLECLEPAEVEAIVAHELGHLREGPRAMLRFVPLMGIALWSFFQPLVEDPLLSIAVLFAGLALLIVSVRRLSRKLEGHADDVAADLVDGAVYARALEKLYEHNMIPAVLGKRATHPSLYDRMLAAGVTPDFPRPAPPPRGNPLPVLLALCVGGAAPALGVLVPAALEGRGHIEVIATVTPHVTASALGDLGLQKFREGKLEEAVTIYGLAVERAPDSPWYPMNLAFTYGHASRCPEAQSTLARAWELSKNDPSVLEHLPVSLPCGSATDDFP